MSLFQRRVRNLMAAVQQKYLLPTCIVLLIVLVVLLYRQEDPTKYASIPDKPFLLCVRLSTPTHTSPPYNFEHHAQH